MVEVKQVYKCEVCGNIVEVVNAGGGTLTCCGQPMKLLQENSVDAALEKHVPVIEKTADGVLVKVGSVEHPMTKDHYIQWIEIHTDNNKVYRKYLTPDNKPQAEFKLTENVAFAREYCNLHGLWKTK